jgi:hypothetical protein
MFTSNVHRFSYGSHIIELSQATMLAVYAMLQLGRVDSDHGKTTRLIDAIKLLRQLQGIGLKEAKDICEIVRDRATYEHGRVSIYFSKFQMKYEGETQPEPKERASSMDHGNHIPGTTTLGGILRQAIDRYPLGSPDREALVGTMTIMAAQEDAYAEDRSGWPAPGTPCVRVDRSLD